MPSGRWIALALLLAVLTPAARAEPTYVNRGTRVETILASLKASGLPTLEGTWHHAGPFDNTANKGFDAVYPPEKSVDLTATYDGKGGAKVGWKEFPGFRPGRVVDLKRFPTSDDSVVYLYHEFDSPQAIAVPVSLGSDDGLKLWLNGELLLSENVIRGAAPDQNEATLKLKAGKNRLLVKVSNVGGEWKFYVAPEMPPSWSARIRKQLERDFPVAVTSASEAAAEAVHYKIATVPVPPHVILEVGGLAFRPDGKLLACTRRGEVWLLSDPSAEETDRVKYKLFASGLHEPLGMHVEGKDLYVVQRPELTKLVDRDGDDAADDHVTVCDKWGVSGDYHEYAFGPARDRAGNFFVTLNVGFGGGHQAKAPWRGWCVKVSPKGEMVPFAAGLRSPNGVACSPDGDLFYCDNQGEWVATNKMHHLREGDNYGHQAGLIWAKHSPFAKSIRESYPSGMLYDGQIGKAKEAGLPPVTPPCIWFPYGRMGQSVSEPCWDTTAGKFGPFAGQCFVGDQTRATVMRVALEKVNGRYQGACFPFRSGLQCGVNRLAFGPDGSVYAGQTRRGWGSFGGKDYGLQRLVYTGVLPFEIHAVKLTKDGFDLSFTKPLDAKSAERLESYSVGSHTYYYWSTYGSPPQDVRAEKVRGVKLSADRRAVSLTVDGLKRGRVYELRLNGVKADDGSDVLHPEAYYTLNELP
jgi:hypothetical protein